ncbi:MAG: hypothetical protein ACYCT2_06595 [Thermoplasmataceae archaeon]
MNKKLTLLLVAAVVTILPAVAVADVMVGGYVNGSGHPISDQFYVQQGSNYATANQTVGFGWTPHPVDESEILGDITIGYMTNETIWAINVLDINFTMGEGQSGYFNITVIVPSALPGGGSGEFPFGSEIWFSTAPFYFSSPGVIDSVGTYHHASLSSAGQKTISFSDVTSTTTIYVAFVIGSGIAAPPPTPAFSLDLFYTNSGNVPV